MFEPGPVPFDPEAVKTWQYPTNYSVRKYQNEMVKTALFHNTIVCLPTGLGKTLIASVVMHNFYRWFPTGICIFVAPTKVRSMYDPSPPQRLASLFGRKVVLTVLKTM